MPDSSPLNNLASTAHWTASVRARENSRQDRLFADPWAATLAGEEGQRWLAQRTPDSVLPIVLRTRYFDDCLQRITQEAAICQVVLLAAGLDTRAFRLAWPEGTHLFELDQPDVLDAKENVLRAAGALPACVRHVLPVDLNGPWQERLVTDGFNPGQPSAWLLEGFLFYIFANQKQVFSFYCLSCCQRDGHSGRKCSPFPWKRPKSTHWNTINK